LFFLFNGFGLDYLPLLIEVPKSSWKFLALRLWLEVDGPFGEGGWIENDVAFMSFIGH
jgi:hypothetical protein